MIVLSVDNERTAYGDAASYCLEYFHVLDNNQDFKLSCLIAYYPTSIPDPQTRFPGGVHVLVHLAGSEVGVVKQSQLLGIQGKRRTTRRNLGRGIGTGQPLQLGYPTYTYDAVPGFAERDLDEYDKVSAELAWSRSLAAARKAFQRAPNMELALEQNVQGKQARARLYCIISRSMARSYDTQGSSSRAT